MKFILKSALVLSIITAGAFACSSKEDDAGNGGGGGGGGELDIDSDLAAKDFADLEDEDKTALCEAINKARAAAAEANAETSCAIAGAVAGAAADNDEDTCTEAKEKCEEDGVEVTELDCDAYAEADFSECEGSVQDLIDCVADSASASSEIEVPACDALEDAEKIELSNPKSCTDLVKSCGAALGHEDVSSSTPTPGDDDDDTPPGDDDDTSGDDDAPASDAGKADAKSE